MFSLATLVKARAQKMGPEILHLTVFPPALNETVLHTLPYARNHISYMHLLSSSVLDGKLFILSLSPHICSRRTFLPLHDSISGFVPLHAPPAQLENPTFTSRLRLVLSQEKFPLSSRVACIVAVSPGLFSTLPPRRLVLGRA